ncbi:restriction endonuclease subunit S [Rhodoglobus sp. NPDC076762]
MTSEAFSITAHRPEQKTLPLMAVARESDVKNISMREKNLLSLSYGKIIRKNIDSNEGLLPGSFETYQIVRPGMTVLRFTDLQNDQRSLRSGLVKEQGIITSAYVAVEPFAADPRFFAYLMRAYDTNKVFYGMGGGVRQGLNFDSIRRLPVPDIPIDEQRTIADYLDRETAQIDALVAKQEELVGLLRERRLSMAESFVWSGLDRTAETSEAGIGPVTNSPSHWRRLRNKNLFREVNVPSKDGQEELLTVSHLTGVTPRSMKNVNMFEAVTTEGYKVVEVGDLAINTMWAWMGALGISAYRGIVSPAYGVYRPTSEEVESGYFDHLFRSRRYVVEMTRHSRGVTASRLRLYPESFLRLGVVVPPADEQRAIARSITQEAAKIDTLIAKANEHIALAKERRSALITAAVTGHLDVRTAQRGA